MLLQLSGLPGSGKSTLARSLAVAGGWVVVDTDVLKSALLTEGVPVLEAGRTTYAAALASAGDLLAQGHDVVIDSPCRYRELLEAGTALARAAGVPYGFVELAAADHAVLLARLATRQPRVSQVSATDPVAGTWWEAGTAEATLALWQRQLVRPEGEVLVLDASAPTGAALPLVLAYCDRLRGSRAP